jgi:hypothetical protein
MFAALDQCRVPFAGDADESLLVFATFLQPLAESYSPIVPGRHAGVVA